VIEICRRAAAPASDDKKKTQDPDKSGRSGFVSEKFACRCPDFTISGNRAAAVFVQQPLWHCPACGGLGVEQHIDEDLVIPTRADLA